MKFPSKWGYNFEKEIISTRDKLTALLIRNEMKNSYNKSVNRNLCSASAIQLNIWRIPPEVLLDRNFKCLSSLRMFLFSSC